MPEFSTFSKPAVLFVNQDPDLNRMFRIYFEGVGFQVDCVTGGLDAVHQCSDNKYDVIVLEVHLPDIDGFELLSQLRKRGIQTPVIYLSRESERNTRIRGLELGAIDFITMPFDIQELQLKMVNLIRLKENYLDRS